MPIETGRSWDGIRDGYVCAPGLRERIAKTVKLHDDAAPIDPVTYEVIRHNLWMLNVEHGDTMRRLSGSPAANIAQDFNPVILMEDGEDLFFGPYIQDLAASCSSAVKWILEHRSVDPGIYEGDIFLENDPWIGVNHQPDVGMLAPVFCDDEIFCWVGNILHVYDLGGSTPGSFCPDATDVFMEPTPIPPIKIVERGDLRRDLEDMYLRHSRAPHLVALDLRAEIAGVVVATRGIKALMTRYGPAVVKAAMRKIIDDGEESFVRRIREVPDGVWTDVGYLEEKAVGDRHAHKLQLSVEKRGDQLIFRNDGTAGQVDGSLNCTLSGWRGAITAAMLPVFSFDQLFAVGGILRHCVFEPSPGTITCARYPAAVSCSPGYAILFTVVQAHRVLGKMGFAAREIRKELSAGGMSSWPLAALSGQDSEGNTIATILVDETGGSIGAYSWRDGISVGGHDWIPLAKQPNIEHNEYFFPILYVYRQLLSDSGGAGKFRGGNTFASCYVRHQASDLMVHTISTGQGVPSGTGIFGGFPGIQSRHLILRGSDIRERFQAGKIPSAITEVIGEETLLPGKSRDNLVGENDIYEQRPTAAAGYGDPLERDPELVKKDVLNNEISYPAAARAYGVIMDADSLEIDEGATSRTRQQLRQDRAANGYVWPNTARNPRSSAPTESVEGVPVHEYLVVAYGRLHCRKCGYDYCPMGENYKYHSLYVNAAVTDLGPQFNNPARYVDDDIAVRYYICPGCLVLTDVELNAPDGDPVQDIKIHALPQGARAERTGATTVVPPRSDALRSTHTSVSAPRLRP